MGVCEAWIVMTGRKISYSNQPALRLTRRQSFELLSQCNVCQHFLRLVPLQNRRKPHCETDCGRLSNLPHKKPSYRLSNGAVTCSRHCKFIFGPLRLNLGSEVHRLRQTTWRSNRKLVGGGERYGPDSVCRQPADAAGTSAIG